MENRPSVDQAQAEEFRDKVIRDLSGFFVTVMGSLGDRLGLFKNLAEKGPATSAELAARAGIHERYAREWLSAEVCAGYLEYDARTLRFTLSPEHAEVLAHEGGGMFLGGRYQMLPALLRPLDQLLEAFRRGGGVTQETFDHDVWEGMERYTATAFDNLLVQQWIPAVPDLQAKLEGGARVADVGCGCGRALIKLAEAFPRCRCFGYDVFGPAVCQATSLATAAGVADRVQFTQLDVMDGLPDEYDLITTFSVVHDMANPLATLRAIRQGLRSNGTYLLLETNCSDKLDENIGTLGAMFYGLSVLFCMTTSLAEGGPGLGALGLPECKVRELCRKAGFLTVRRVALENPFNTLYEVRP